jgi:chromosome segregation ATPase
MALTSNAVQSTDSFVEELRQKKYSVGQILATKKSELNALDQDQRRLSTLIGSEKQSNGGNKQKKNKHQPQAKEVRLDIVRNEQKHKEQARKYDELRREVQHLESELKSITHDLSVVDR